MIAVQRSLNSLGGILMITFKVIAIAIGAGAVFWIYSGDLGGDLLLAIVSCLT